MHYYPLLFIYYIFHKNIQYIYLIIYFSLNYFLKRFNFKLNFKLNLILNLTLTDIILRILTEHKFFYHLSFYQKLDIFKTVLFSVNRYYNK